MNRVKTTLWGGPLDGQKCEVEVGLRSIQITILPERTGPAVRQQQDPQDWLPPLPTATYTLRLHRKTGEWRYAWERPT